MKKRTLILLILALPILGFLSLGLSQETTEKTVKKETIHEDELVLEDWMMKPFVITENKNK